MLLESEINVTKQVVGNTYRDRRTCQQWIGRLHPDVQYGLTLCT